MKKIFLIERVPDGLKTIKTYLSDSNTSFSRFSSTQDAAKSGETPDLIILLGSQYPAQITSELNDLKAHPSYSRTPRILILPFGARLLEIPDLIDGQPYFEIPVEKLKFLSVVAKCLKRSPRRVFRIIITIQPEDSNIRYSGISMDFSETGMAFEGTCDLPIDQKIKVNFVNPRNRTRFILDAEVVRRASTQTGGTSYYGVMFRKMTEPDTRELIKFITGED